MTDGARDRTVSSVCQRRASYNVPRPEFRVQRTSRAAIRIGPAERAVLLARENAWILEELVRMSACRYAYLLVQGSGAIMHHTRSVREATHALARVAH